MKSQDTVIGENPTTTHAIVTDIRNLISLRAGLGIVLPAPIRLSPRAFALIAKRHASHRSHPPTQT